MKYCVNCDKEFETEENICETCENELKILSDDTSDGYEAAEIVSAMMTTGII